MKGLMPCEGFLSIGGGSKKRGQRASRKRGMGSRGAFLHSAPEKGQGPREARDSGEGGRFLAGVRPPPDHILRERPRQGISLSVMEAGKEGDLEEGLVLNALEEDGTPEFLSCQAKSAQVGEGFEGSHPEASGDFRADFHKIPGKGCQKFEIAVGGPHVVQSKADPPAPERGNDGGHRPGFADPVAGDLENQSVGRNPCPFALRLDPSCQIRLKEKIGSDIEGEDRPDPLLVKVCQGLEGLAKAEPEKPGTLGRVHPGEESPGRNKLIGPDSDSGQPFQ